MTRRGFLFLTGAGVSHGWQAPVIVPVQHIVDSRMRADSRRLAYFWREIWPQAVRDLGKSGIRVEATTAQGEIRRAASGTPIFVGLARNRINMVITDRLPVVWDRGRGLAGVTTLHEGFHLCLISLQEAHGHQVPFLSVNTCLHELLHALLLDIFERRPKGFAGDTRELRVDAYATRLWLFRDGSGVREAARTYVERLRDTGAVRRLTAK